MSNSTKKKDDLILKLKENLENWINSEEDDPTTLREAVLNLLKEYAKDFLVRGEGLD